MRERLTINMSHRGGRPTDTYAGTVNAIVDASKFFHRSVDHGLYAGLIRNVHLESERMIAGVFRVLMAFLRGFLGALFVNISENNTLNAGFREGEGSISTDPSRRLY
jgi:hypothetical protein